MKKQRVYEEKALKVLMDLHDILPVETNEMPWDEYQFKLFNDDSIENDMSSGNEQNMNDILADLFSIKRMAQIKEIKPKKNK